MINNLFRHQKNEAMKTSANLNQFRQVLRRKEFIVLMFAFYTIMNSCSLTHDVVQNTKVTGKNICPVCEIQIPSQAESYDYKVNEKHYLFESYECKQVFKKNPVKFSINGSIISVKN